MDQHMQDLDAAMRTLAIARRIRSIVRDNLEPLEAVAKAHLADATRPGNIQITTDAGVDIGTFVHTKPGETITYRVVDEDAYAEWCELHGVPYTYETRLIAQDVAPSQVENVVKRSGGELPDGVEADVRETSPRLYAKQTEKQAAAFDNLVAIAQTISNELAALTDHREDN